MAKKRNENKYAKAPQIFFYIILLLVAVVTYNTSNPFSDVIPDWYVLTGQEKSEYTNTTLSDIPLNEYGFITTDFETSVHVIDVGQGNCTLIFSNGEAMLIDAGDNGTQDVIIEYLDQMGIDKLKYAVATHPHADHIGSMDDILNEIEVENIIMPQIPDEIIPTSQTYEKFLTAVDENNVNVIKAQPQNSYILGDSVFYVLSPMAEYGDLNNMSAAIRFTYNQSSFLIAADIEAEAESDILASGQELKSDVLLLGHHGSNTSNTEEFLNAVGAKYYVAQVGYDNEFGHPHEEVYNSVMALDGEFYRSDVHGHIIFAVNGSDISVITQK